MFGLGNDANVIIEIGRTYLYVWSCYVFFSIMFLSNGIINGAGHAECYNGFYLCVDMDNKGAIFGGCCQRPTFGITGIWNAVSMSFIITMMVSLGYYFQEDGRNPETCVPTGTPV